VGKKEKLENTIRAEFLDLRSWRSLQLDAGKLTIAGERSVNWWFYLVLRYFESWSVKLGKIILVVEVTFVAQYHRSKYDFAGTKVASRHYSKCSIFKFWIWVIIFFIAYTYTSTILILILDEKAELMSLLSLFFSLFVLIVIKQCYQLSWISMRILYITWQKGIWS
jgi:hypothetical protein